MRDDMRIKTVILGILLLVCLPGCQQRTANKLAGRWTGKPDTAAARAVREAEKYGEQSEVATADSREPNTSATVASTDWESVEVTIELQFVDRQQIKMSLGSGEQPVSGTWKVVTTTPAGCTIEVETKSADQSDTEDTSTVRRRFDLLLDERDGECVGFTLSESGADPRVGAIYFKRPEVN